MESGRFAVRKRFCAGAEIIAKISIVYVTSLEIGRRQIFAGIIWTIAVVKQFVHAETINQVYYKYSVRHILIYQKLF